jgi:O-methyltransferase domain
MILAKAFKALKSGGRIIIQEYMMDDAKKERSNSFLLSLSMQLAASHGNENSQEEMAQKLKNAGFLNPTFTELDHIQTVVVAFKP